MGRKRGKAVCRHDFIRRGIIGQIDPPKPKELPDVRSPKEMAEHLYGTMPLHDAMAFIIRQWKATTDNEIKDLWNRTQAWFCMLPDDPRRLG